MVRRNVMTNYKLGRARRSFQRFYLRKRLFGRSLDGPSQSTIHVGKSRKSLLCLNRLAADGAKVDCV